MEQRNIKIDRNDTCVTETMAIGNLGVVGGFVVSAHDAVVPCSRF